MVLTLTYHSFLKSRCSFYKKTIAVMRHSGGFDIPINYRNGALEDCLESVLLIGGDARVRKDSLVLLAKARWL